MIGVFENRNKTLAEASVIGREHVAQPMERLDKAHGGTARPVMSAGGGSLKVEGEGAQAAIGEYGDACGNGVCESLNRWWR
jgi:hypothetical protein